MGVDLISKACSVDRPLHPPFHLHLQWHIQAESLA